MAGDIGFHNAYAVVYRDASRAVHYSPSCMRGAF